MAKQRKRKALVPLVEDYQIPEGFIPAPVISGFWTATKPGDSITGRFAGIEKVTIQGKEAERGVLVTEAGSVGLPSHWRLNELLRYAEAHKGPDGVEVHVVYLGERAASNVLSKKIIEYAVGYKPLG